MPATAMTIGDAGPDPALTPDGAGPVPPPGSSLAMPSPQSEGAFTQYQLSKGHHVQAQQMSPGGSRVRRAPSTRRHGTLGVGKGRAPQATLDIDYGTRFPGAPTQNALLTLTRQTEGFFNERSNTAQLSYTSYPLARGYGWTPRARSQGPLPRAPPPRCFTPPTRLTSLLSPAPADHPPTR
jgi:hypothetical protein